MEQDVSSQPGPILLDVMLPEMDGPQVLWNLRVLYPLAQTPVEFVAAQAQDV